MVRLVVSAAKNSELGGQTGFFGQERDGTDAVEAMSTRSQGWQDQREDSQPFWFFFFFFGIFSWPCHPACEILVPQPGIVPVSLALEA